MRFSAFLFLCFSTVIWTSCVQSNSAKQAQNKLQIEDSVLKKAEKGLETVGTAADKVGNEAISKVEHLGDGVKNGAIRIVDGAKMVIETSEEAADTAESVIKQESEKTKAVVVKRL